MVDFEQKYVCMSFIPYVAWQEENLHHIEKKGKIPFSIYCYMYLRKVSNRGSVI